MFERAYLFVMWVGPRVLVGEVLLLVGVLLGQWSVFRKAERIVWKTK